ncbi:hypothetical protein [Agriterribacter sp.]|uniref:hypothetical protein n=1 Tax=Agriterribacter sp. TaxID=2821509 RepID=UPI002C404DE0|nr:hypothetical protein [Agriterribacter sp.]HRO45881.1 hypothetical protein [Agriterribacter sp.]
MEWKDYLYGYDDGYNHGRSGEANSGCNLLFALSWLVITLSIFLIKLLYLLIKGVIKLFIYLLIGCFKITWRR